MFPGLSIFGKPPENRYFLIFYLRKTLPGNNAYLLASMMSVHVLDFWNILAVVSLSYLSGWSHLSTAGWHIVPLFLTKSRHEPSPTHSERCMQLDCGYDELQLYASPTHRPLLQKSFLVHALLSLQWSPGLLVHTELFLEALWYKSHHWHSLLGFSCWWP